MEKLLPEFLQHMMGNNAGFYHGRNTDRYDRYAHGFGGNTGTGITDSSARCDTGAADLNGAADSADISGSQSVNGDNQFWTNLPGDAANQFSGFYTGHAEYTGCNY